MTKIADIFTEKQQTFSFELFPPRTEQGYANLMALLADLCLLQPDFISCTYGAGGGNRAKTLDIVEHIQKKHHVTALAHLTCVLHTKAEIKTILEDIRRRGVENVLALRGDPPLDNPGWEPGPENFEFAKDLCAFIHSHFGDHFSVGVAGFPEGHILCRDLETDARYLKMKLDSGADFVITQLFFDNDHYFRYVERLRRLGVKNRVIPGLLPVVNYEGLLKFCKLGGASITDEVKKIFEPLRDDPDATLKAGTDFAIRQSLSLLKGGAPGIHLYCLNKLHPAAEILFAVRTEKTGNNV